MPFYDELERSLRDMPRQFGRGPAGIASKEFDEWLQGVLVSDSPQKRAESLLKWAEAPSARAAHPQEDHLLPLMVAVGAAEGENATLIYHENKFMGNMTVSSFRFG